MKRKRRAAQGGLPFTKEAVEDFAKLTPAQRLEWLDEMRAFMIAANGKVKEISPRYGKTCRCHGSA